MAATITEAQHPDGFVADLIDLDPAAACEAVRVIRRRLRNPPRTADEYFLTLEGQGLAGAVARLRDFAPLIRLLSVNPSPWGSARIRSFGVPCFRSSSSLEWSFPFD